MVAIARALATALLASALLAGTGNAAAHLPTLLKTLQLSDLRKLVSVSAPKLSPDGREVVVLVGRNDFDDDRTIVDLTLVNVRSRQSRVLVHDENVRGLAWSPDGSTIAYVATPKYGPQKAPQLFLLSMLGGEPVQLTHEKEGVDDLAWRPDGRALAYTAVPPPRNPDAIAHEENAFDVTEEAWTAQSAATSDRLYEIGTRDGSTPHAIGDDALRVDGGFTYAADGRSIFVTRIAPGAQPNEYLAREIVRVDVRSGSVTAISRLSRTQLDPIRSLDGKHIAFAFTNPHGAMQIEVALANAAGMQPSWASRRLDRDIEEAAFTPNDALVVMADSGTLRSLFLLGARGASTLPLGGLSATGSFDVARTGAIAFTASSPTHPSELYVLEPGARAPVRLTDENRWVESFAIGKQTAITWRTRDGMLADGVLVYPPGWHRGARVPLVLLIHGGPTAASLVTFSALADVFAAHGWIVFEPNYRGSDNLGLAFARTTVPHIASVPGDDIEDGLAAVLRLGVADPARIGVSGWSEGGLMTSWLITHDTRWKAAVAGAAVNDWVGYAAMTDAKDFTPLFIGPSPWTDPAMMRLYEAESPLTYASRVRTPTLILSDANDYRVPTPLAYEFYQGVRATGTPVKFVIWPVVGHFPSDPVREEDVYRQWEAWLAQYL